MTAMNHYAKSKGIGSGWYVRARTPKCAHRSSLVAELNCELWHGFAMTRAES